MDNKWYSIYMFKRFTKLNVFKPMRLNVNQIIMRFRKLKGYDL